jgi:hypothetical protein
MAEQLYFQPVKEHRGHYFVSYQPPVGSNAFATLSLVFLADIADERAVGPMEQELVRWLERYSVPLMISAFSSEDELLSPNGPEQPCHLTGWYAPGTERVVVRSWIPGELDAFLRTTFQKPDWRTIYLDIPYKIDDEVKASVAHSVRRTQIQNRTLKIVLVFWLAVVPAGLAAFEYFGPQWLALAVLLLSLWKACQAGLKIWGKVQPSTAETAKAEKRRKMAHYYYHCELNHRAFASLLAENLGQDLREQTLREAAELKCHAEGGGKG